MGLVEKCFVSAFENCRDLPQSLVRANPRNAPTPCLALRPHGTRTRCFVLADLALASRRRHSP
jgi:hypothetical protein